jgi:outer membrane protein OmpA-like peptidoglycan-associated protein
MRFPFFLSFLFVFFAAAEGWAQTTIPGGKPPVVLVTDDSWEVSGQKTTFGEYPLSAEQVAAPGTALPGGTHRATAAEYNPESKIVPGSVPIWRNRTAEGEVEAYQFRKTVALGPEPIVRAILEVNCDDVARVYINQRLATAEKRDGTLKDGYDVWRLFRSLSGFTYRRVYTYDVTDYFFTNVTNNILIEAASMAFDGSHAYVSAKIVLEFGQIPAPVKSPKPKPATKPKPTSDKAVVSAPAPAKAPAAPLVFEAGHDLAIEKLHVGSILELGSVHFKANDYKLDTSSYNTLYALALFMRQHPSLKVEVGGHTNLLPNEQFAAELSTNRARSVARYLTDNGVAADRVTCKGYGKSQPRMRAMNREADRVNQRVEVRVLAR